MSPKAWNRGGNRVAPNNLYTVVLALAFLVVLATAAFVAYKCYFQYDTVFGVPKSSLPQRSFKIR